MLVEFVRHGKTYQFAHDALINESPPATLTIPFRPCTLRPPMRLELAWVGTDDVRMIQIYKPVKEVR